MRYGIAVGSVAVVTTIGLWFTSFTYITPFLFFCPAVMLTAWFGGFRAGLLATALSTLAGNYFLLGPHGFKFDVSNLVRTFAYFVIFVAVSRFAELARKEPHVRRQLAQAAAAEVLQKISTYNRSLLEASLDPLVTIGPDGKITDVNAATEAVTGCARAALIGTDFSDYFTDPEKARAGYQQVFREGFVRDYPLELRHRDGRITSVLYNASVYRDESGKVIGVFAAARDVTARKRAEEEVRLLNAGLERRVAECTAQLQTANEELLKEIAERKRAEEALRQAEAAAHEVTRRLQALMEAVPVGISFSDDSTCQRVSGNPAVLAQFEVDPQDNLSASAPDPTAPGRRVRFFQDGHEISDAELSLQRAVAENRVIPPTEFEVVLPSGRRWSCEASGAPVRDARAECSPASPLP